MYHLLPSVFLTNVPDAFQVVTWLPVNGEKKKPKGKKEPAFENSEDGCCGELNEVDKENQRDAEPHVV